MNVDHRPSKGVNCRWLDAPKLSDAETGEIELSVSGRTSGEEIADQSIIPHNSSTLPRKYCYQV